MTALSSGVDSSLATKCMDFCHALANQGKKFKFSLSIGSTFTFSLDTREGKETLPARSKKSPSTLKRNAKRRQEILKKKSEPVLTGMESNQKPIEKDDAFQCNQCEIGFKTRNGLKIHVGKTHKEAAKSPEKLRESDSKLPITLSPLRATTREVPCHNCGEEMSLTHLCEEEAPVGVEQGIGGGDEDHRTIDPDPANESGCTIYCFKNCIMICECDCPSCNAD